MTIFVRICLSRSLVHLTSFKGHRSERNDWFQRGLNVALPQSGTLLIVDHHASSQASSSTSRSVTASLVSSPLVLHQLNVIDQDWLNVFWYFDRDHSGTIDGNELKQALERFGCALYFHPVSSGVFTFRACRYTNFSPQLMQLIEKKYCTSLGSLYQRVIIVDPRVSLSSCYRSPTRSSGDFL